MKIFYRLIPPPDFRAVRKVPLLLDAGNLVSAGGFCAWNDDVPGSDDTVRERGGARGDSSLWTTG